MDGNLKGPNFIEASNNLSAGIFLKSCKELAPTCLANSTPFLSASDKGSGGSVPNMEPLSPIAPAIKFLDKGETICALTETDPADSPAIVTRFGSPPKDAIFSLTHFNAAA